jgi:hypothetical protein
MRAVLRCTRYGYLLVFHILLLCAAGRNPTGAAVTTGSFCATLYNLGDVTIVLSKKRRNDGPKGVKILVTNLTKASAEAILSMYAWRWGVELTIKELKSGLHLGQMQVTKEASPTKPAEIPERCAIIANKLPWNKPDASLPSHAASADLSQYGAWRAGAWAWLTAGGSPGT